MQHKSVDEENLQAVSPIKSEIGELPFPFPSIIRLNVGGGSFCTTLETLREGDPHSMFASMFSGRLPVVMDDNGAYFIDRNPTTFHYVLDALRGQVVLPQDRHMLEGLLNEARYYCMESLKVTPSTFISRLTLHIDRFCLLTSAR